ncbi:LCP family protein, partial [Candidatus Bipolaricaulota bacterium]|nr:LCP family protein [Candidatus Bipolaricaulota bacterium]
LFAQGDRVNMLLIGHDSAQSVDLITLLSFSETDIVLFSFPANLRLRDTSGAFEQAAMLCQNAGATATTEAIATLIGLEIPFYVSFGHDILEAWIETLGGLAIFLEASAMYIDSTADPAMRIEIRLGEQQFDGSGAIAFLTAPSEPGDIGLLKRQQAFLQALLAQGIGAPGLRSLRSTIREMAPALETNLSLAGLLQTVEVLHEIPSGNMRTNQLVGEIVEIDGVPYTQPNVVETERLVAALLKGLELLTPGDVKVAVFNGNGVRLMARRTADYLTARGFQVTGIANAYPFDYETSYVIVLSDESKAWVLRDALLSDVQIVFPETFESRYETVKDFVWAGTDIVLIVGAGWEIE